MEARCDVAILRYAAADVVALSDPLKNSELMHDIEEGAAWSDIGAPVSKNCSGEDQTNTAKDHCQKKWPHDLFKMKECIKECQDDRLVRIKFGSTTDGGIAEQTLAPEKYVPAKWEFNSTDEGKEMRITGESYADTRYSKNQRFSFKVETRINQGLFSKADEGRFIVVKFRKVYVNVSKGTRSITVSWLSNVTDGNHKKITSVDDKIDGIVSLDGGREFFRNPGNPECSTYRPPPPPPPECWYRSPKAEEYFSDSFKERCKGKTITGKIRNVTEGESSNASGTLTLQDATTADGAQSTWGADEDDLVVKIGSSSASTKNISNPEGHKCPSVVGIWNRIHDEHDLENDKFLITQSGAILSAKRLDRETGWNIDLKITCKLMKV